MRALTYRLFCLSLISVLLVACGDDDDDEPPPCNAEADTGCGPDQTCEVVTGGGTVCADPVVVRGSVFNLADETAIEGARVVAIDVNGAPLSSVAVTDVNGDYELAIPHERNRDGDPVPLDATLRADASGFQTFPSGIRQSLPVATSGATAEDGKLVVQNALTEIGLIEISAATGSISGTVQLPESGNGVLVVAELGGEGHSGVADADGNYRIFNLPAGSYTVTGYSRGSSFESKTVEVAEDADVDADLGLSDEPTGSISGKVSIVNPGQGDATSIILVLESLYDEETQRGESPPGLRAPDPGLPPDVTGDFSIDGIPAGTYVILAAFENDFLVRDPDTSIGGTEILVQPVAAGEEIVLAESFKITGSLNFIEPLGLDPVGVTEAPVISWEDDSSEDSYELVVYDALGDLVWSHTEPSHSGDDPAVTYGGPTDPGMYYQVKIRSIKDGVPISQTEDLAGIFFVQ